MSKLKPVLKCNHNLKSKFAASSCLLTISVGQESHEGERNATTMSLISATFQSCIITLHDSLQRYTIELTKEQDADFFHETAISAGNNWLARNKKYFSYFQNEPKVIRWDDWLKDPDYETYKNIITQTIQLDASYQNTFENTIDEYLTRYIKRLDNPESFDQNRAHALCLDYLIEECAVLCLWQKTGCQFELYAGKHNAAMQETRKRFISHMHPNLIQPVMIGFNHRPDMQPQHFAVNKKEVVGDYA